MEIKILFYLDENDHDSVSVDVQSNVDDLRYVAMAAGSLITIISDFMEKPKSEICEMLLARDN